MFQPGAYHYGVFAGPVSGCGCSGFGQDATTTATPAAAPAPALTPVQQAVVAPSKLLTWAKVGIIAAIAVGGIWFGRKQGFF